MGLVSENNASSKDFFLHHSDDMAFSIVVGLEVRMFFLARLSSGQNYIMANSTNRCFLLRRYLVLLTKFR